MSILNVVKRTAIISAVFCSAPFKRNLKVIHTLRRMKKQVRQSTRACGCGLWIYSPVLLLTKKKPTETAVGVGWEDYFLTKVPMQLLGQSSV
jgi:hypothetical protein